MIVSYYAPLPGLTEARDALSRLPAWRREKAQTIQNEAAFRRSVGAGLLYSFALRAQGLDPERPAAFLGAGKPVYPEGDVHFSLSHSGPYVFCTLGDTPLGADIQEPRPVRLSMARRFCPEEQAYLQALPDAEQTEALLRLWCRKEAWVKAESRERMLRLDEYNVLADGPWLFTDLRLPGGVWGAVCARSPAPDPHFVDVYRL